MQDSIVVFENVSKASKATRRGELRSIDFSIEPGEVFTIVGMNQWERRKLIDLISALDQPDKGKIFFEGTDLGSRGELDLNALRGRMGFATSPPGFLNNVRLMENLRLPLRYHSDHNTDEIDAILSEILDDMGISGFSDVIPSNFGPHFLGGVALARALSTRPRLLVLERPGESLDRSVSRKLTKLWKKYVLEHNGAVLILTGIPRLALAVSDRIADFEINRIKGIMEKDEYRLSLKKEDTQWR